MATADIALILSHLHLGPRALHPEVRDALAAAASGPPAQIILAGHTLGLDLAREPDAAAQANLTEGLRLVGQAARGGLTILPGPHEDSLLHAETQERLAALCGLQPPDISFGEELLPGLLGKRLNLGEEVVFVVSARGLDPLGGLHLPDVLRWSGLRGFVKAYARQLKGPVAPPSVESPQHHVAHALARAVVKLAPGKEEPLLGELGRLAEGHHPEDGPLGELLRLTREMLHDSLVERVRHRVGTSVAAVVIGAARTGLFEHGRPVLVCTGSASVEQPSWVELPLRGPERPLLRGSGHQARQAPSLAPQQSAPPAPASAPTPAAPPLPTSPSTEASPAAKFETSSPPEAGAPAEVPAVQEAPIAPEAPASQEPTPAQEAASPAEASAPAEPSAQAETSAPAEGSAQAEASGSTPAPRRDSVAPLQPRGGSQPGGAPRQAERQQDRDKRRNKPQQQPQSQQQQQQQTQRAGGEPQQSPPGGEPPKGSTE